MSYGQFFADHVDGLRVHPNGRQAYGRCPLHEDQVQSFSVNLATSQWFCHAKCGSGNALTFARRLGVRPPNDSDGLAQPSSPTFSTPTRASRPAAVQEKDTNASAGPPQICATHEYQYEDGAPAHRTLRYAPKSFRQQGWKDGQWVWSMEGVRRVPYRLPQLLKATGTVYLVEGEKDVETLERIGLTATTTPMGAKSWSADYAPFFKGKYVTILPDNDEPGEAYALQTAADIRAVGGFVKIARLPGLQPKEDVTDYLENDANSKDTLLRFVMSVPPFGQVRHSEEDPVAYLNRFGISANDGAGYFNSEYKEVCAENYRAFINTAKNCTDLVMKKLEEVHQLWAACRTKSQYQRFLRALKEAHELSMADAA